MNQALIVVDMQEFCTGKNHEKMFTYNNEKLITEVNKIITQYEPNSVYYIKNIINDKITNKFAKFKVYENSKESDLVKGLEVVSENIYVKHTGDAFSNPELAENLKQNNWNEIAIIGVDGAGCVPLTALGAIKAGFKVTLITSAITTSWESKALKFKQKLEKSGAKFV